MPDPTDIVKVLEDAFKSAHQGRIYRRLRVFTEWPRIVGEQNARMARPVGFRGKTLVVKSEDSAWANRLKFMEDDLLKRIAEQIGDGFVTRIQFVIGELSGLARDTEEEEPPKASAKDRKKIAKLLDVPELAGKDALKADFEALFANLSTHSISSRRPKTKNQKPKTRSTKECS